MNQTNQETLVGKIGRALVNHFSELFISEDSIILCVNKELLDSLCIGLDISPILFERSVLNVFKNGFLGDEYNSVAIAGFQVSIAYDNLVQCKESYNQVLQELLNYSYSNLQSLYSDFQDKIWEDTKRCFKRKSLNLIIPKPKKYSYRYVQYPFSQKIIEQSDLTKCKEVFSKIHLRPDSALSFSQFSDLVFEKHKNYTKASFVNDHPEIKSTEYNKIAKKVIFGAYLAWDGAQQEKRKRNKGTAEERESSSEKTFYIKVFNGEGFHCLDREGNAFSVRQMVDERKIFYEYDQKYKIWRNIPRIVKTDCFGKLMQTELLERLIKNNVDIGNNILECYRQGGFSFIVISADLPIEMYCRFSINFSLKGFAHLCGGLKNTEGDYIQGILPTVVMDEKYEEFYIDSVRYSVINNRFDLNTISLQPGPHAIKAKETGIIGFTIAENIIVEPGVRFGWKYQWRAAPMVTTPIPECVLHGLIFNTDVFPKRMTIKTLQNTTRICMSRNQELMNRPYSDSIRLHLAKRRNIDEF